MKLLAMINNCQQYSPDSFEDKPDLLEIKPETTIQNLLDWQKRTRGWKDDFEFTISNYHQIHIVAMEDSPQQA